MRGNITWVLVQDMFPWILSFTLDHVRHLKVRTLSIVGEKGDHVPMIERTADAWPQDGSGAIMLREATHAWDMRFPELFAQGVTA